MMATLNGRDGGLFVGAVRERGPGELREHPGNPLEPHPLCLVPDPVAREHGLVELVGVPVDPVTTCFGHRGRDEDTTVGRAAHRAELRDSPSVREEVLGRRLAGLDPNLFQAPLCEDENTREQGRCPVSYTHLTLPTI